MPRFMFIFCERCGKRTFNPYNMFCSDVSQEEPVQLCIKCHVDFRKFLNSEKEAGSFLDMISAIQESEKELHVF